MVTPAGCVIVIDFGLVAEFHAAAPEPVTSGSVQGALEYMSQEPCEGESLKPASDWYSIGVMVYFALTARLPFSGAHLTGKQAGALVPPRGFEPDVPARRTLPVGPRGAQRSPRRDCLCIRFRSTFFIGLRS